MAENMTKEYKVKEKNAKTTFYIVTKYFPRQHFPFSSKPRYTCFFYESMAHTGTYILYLEYTNA